MADQYGQQDRRQNNKGGNLVSFHRHSPFTELGSRKFLPITRDFLDGPWPTTVADLPDGLITDRAIDKRLSRAVQGQSGVSG
jgi:hypothetical protein